jgi:hypothetical protein
LILADSRGVRDAAVSKPSGGTILGLRYAAPRAEKSKENERVAKLAPSPSTARIQVFTHLLIHSAGKKATIDCNNLSSCVGAFIRCQKDRGSNQFFDAAEAVHGRSQQKLVAAR